MASEHILNTRRHDPEAGPPLELPIRSRDRSAPEFQGEGYDQASNPFVTDVYYLGNEIKTKIFEAACVTGGAAFHIGCS